MNRALFCLGALGLTGCMRLDAFPRNASWDPESPVYGCHQNECGGAAPIDTPSSS